MIRVTRRYRFSASHRLHSAGLSEADNTKLYGKCNNPYGHGHDYLLEVTAKGPLDPTGRVVNPATLDGLVAQYVLKDLDHSNLNEDVPDFAAVVPTSENLTIAIEERLQHAWKSVFPGEWPRLDAVRLRETKRNGFERLT
jgi:6-pyruvoyltetrahydropterin/6-carboxytetrahydropterin synthase